MNQEKPTKFYKNHPPAHLDERPLLMWPVPELSRNRYRRPCSPSFFLMISSLIHTLATTGLLFHLFSLLGQSGELAFAAIGGVILSFAMIRHQSTVKKWFESPLKPLKSEEDIDAGMSEIREALRFYRSALLLNCFIQFCIVMQIETWTPWLTSSLVWLNGLLSVFVLFFQSISITDSSGYGLYFDESSIPPRK